LSIRRKIGERREGWAGKRRKFEKGWKPEKRANE
jgi:hypothetical protein